MKHSSLLRSFLVIGLVMTLAALGFAQTSNGTISGTVADPTGAAITTATITVKSVQTGDTHTVVTNNIGGYRVESLIPGTYNVTVNAAGFATTEMKDVQVTGSLVTSLNVALKLGHTGETINVEANAITLQTESGEISSTITSEQVQNLPIGNLNAYSLATTLPGVTTVTAADMSNGTSYSVNGARPRANNFLIEGQDNNDAGIHGQGLQPINLEAVKEVTVLTNAYSAEFGRGSSVANMIFKSGSNNFHGSLWDRMMNSTLDATGHDLLRSDPNAQKSKYRENLFGFTFSGPMVKDKLFFFTSYQWDKYRSSSKAGELMVPTAAGFTKLQAYAADQRVANLLSAYGNLRGAATPTPNFECIRLGLDPTTSVDRGCVEFDVTRRAVAFQSDSPEFDIKGDYIISKSDTLNLRYIRSRYTAPYDTSNWGYQMPGFDAMQDGSSHNAGITETHIFTPSLLNEFRASYGRIGFMFDYRPETAANPLAQLPALGIGGIDAYGAPGGAPQGRMHNTYQMQDSISWTKGTHFLKFGIDLQDTRVVDAVPIDVYGDVGYGASTFGGVTYTALANFIDNFSGSGTSVSRTNGDRFTRPQLLNQNYFAQDTWKLRSNLTLDLGFRYEYSGAPFNSIAAPALPTDVTCFTCVQKEVADKEDWGPRLGFSYSPRFFKGLFGDQKTVIRGAFGVFYDQIFTNIADNIQSSAPNMAFPTIYATTLSAVHPRGTANWYSQFNNLSTSNVGSAQDFSDPITPHLLNPRILQWNMNVQRELPLKLIAQVAYVGTRGEHLFANTEFNPRVVPFSTRLYPSRGRIVLRDNSADSMYHGLNAELRRQVARGLQFQVAYTFSKFMDDASEIFTASNSSGASWSSYPEVQHPLNRKASDWGLSAYDHRQRLAISYVYDLPKWQNGNGFAKAVQTVVNGWQIAGTMAFQSGNPANVLVGYDVNGDGINNDRPMLGNPKAALNTWAFEGESWMGTAPGVWCEGSAAWYTSDPCHVVDPNQVRWLVPAYGTQGKTIGRNYVQAKGYQNWDFSIQRTIKLHEKHQFDVRAEMFNVFNHGNTGTPTYSLIGGLPYAGYGNVTFNDYARTVTGNRNVRFLLKYSF